MVDSMHSCGQPELATGGRELTSLAARGSYDVRQFGAVGDGETLDTAAIQKAIDTCAADGGGLVCLRSGTFLSGTIILKSNVTLYVEAGATLLGSRNMDDYPDINPKVKYLYSTRFTKYMIYAERAENIGIAGRGTINGQGQFYKKPHGDKLRPYIVRFAECKNVRVTGVTFLNSARWLSHYLACEDVVIDGIKIHSRLRENRDGIDVDSCRWVRISNCHIYSGDDAIVLKATAHRLCQHVTVTNCGAQRRPQRVQAGYRIERRLRGYHLQQLHNLQLGLVRHRTDDGRRRYAQTGEYLEHHDA